MEQVPIKHESLKDFGTTFQYQLSYILMTDKKYFEQIFDIFDYSAFDSSAIKWLMKCTKNHYTEYKELPDFDNYKIYLQKEDFDKAKNTNIVYALQKILNQKNKNNTKLIKDTALDFFKNQNLSKVMFEAVDLIKQKKYDQIREKLNHALNAGHDTDFGLNYVEDVEKRYNEDRRNLISYGYSVLDEYTGGGIGPGELAVIVANSGIGKSFLLSHITTRMLINGIKVVYYNLEDNASYIGRRIDSILMKDTNENIKYKLDELKKIIDKKIKANLIVKDFPSHVSNINHFMRHFNHLHLIDFKPDIVIIDYGDIIDNVKQKNSDWLDQIQKYEELKSMAQQLNIPVITASQAGKQALEKEVVEAQDLQRAYGKVAPCGFILGISRKISDKLNHTGRLHIAKNRYGPDGITIPAQIDHGKGVFELYKPDSKRGIDLMQQMDLNGDDLTAGIDRLKSKFQNLNI